MTVVASQKQRSCCKRAWQWKCGSGEILNQSGNGHLTHNGDFVLDPLLGFWKEHRILVHQRGGSGGHNLRPLDSASIHRVAWQHLPGALG